MFNTISMFDDFRRSMFDDFIQDFIRIYKNIFLFVSYSSYYFQPYFFPEIARKTYIWKNILQHKFKENEQNCLLNCST